MHISEDTIYYRYYNENPKNRNVGDCVFRALSVFLDKTWEEIAEISMDYYLETGGVLENRSYETSNQLRDLSNFERYIMNIAECRIVERREYIPNNSENRYVPSTICDVIKNCADDEHRYLIVLNGHVTVVKNKKILDTWDCSLCEPARVYEISARNTR